MAGLIPGASTPVLLPSNPPAAVRRIPADSRTRRVHGVFGLGDELAVVYSARAADTPRVSLELGADADRRALHMTAEQARSMARALVVAAEATDTACRRPPVERAPRAGRQQQEGGAQ